MDGCGGLSADLTRMDVEWFVCSHGMDGARVVFVLTYMYGSGWSHW